MPQLHIHVYTVVIADQRRVRYGREPALVFHTYFGFSAYNHHVHISSAVQDTRLVSLHAFPLCDVGLQDLFNWSD